MTPANSSANTANRRKNFRYKLVTEVTYCGVSAAGAALVGRGMTLDMSAGGILVELDRTSPERSLEAGSAVQLSLAWPGLYQIGRAHV